METTIVGVDGSACGDAALEYAVNEAARRRGRLLIISAYELTAFTDPGGVFPPEALGRLEERAEQNVRAAISRAAELQPTVPTEGKAVEGQPAHVLASEAQEALNLGEGEVLLVVGSRGRGGFTSLLLGSVSQQVIHHAPCTVVVVRGATC